MKIYFKRQSRRAVALVFFTLIFSVFLGFTMMVMNTGQLIYQKIRLQSAVDLASYAGASVQASYLENGSSGQDSIQAANMRIQERYFDLLKDLDFGTVAPHPVFMPDPASCAAACMGSNLMNGNHAVQLYRDAVSDIDQEHQKIQRILGQMPEATRRAVEETIALNIPELRVQGAALGASQTTNQVEDLVRGNTSIFEEKKNAVLSFSSDKGMYLSTVTAPVPHSFIFYGPACFNACPDPTKCGLQYYCTVNGAGVGGGWSAFAMAVAALGRGFAGGQYSGNIGRIKDISEPDSNAIRLKVIEDVFKPQPFVIAAAEWHPQIGSRMNLENSFGAKEESFFPDSTRLVAVSGAEPFGSSLAPEYRIPYGTRLQGLRKLLLDPRMESVRGDYNSIYDYMKFLGPRDAQGQSSEEAEDVIRRFLH